MECDYSDTQSISTVHICTIVRHKLYFLVDQNKQIKKIANVGKFVYEHSYIKIKRKFRIEPRMQRDSLKNSAQLPIFLFRST